MFHCYPFKFWNSQVYSFLQWASQPFFPPRYWNNLGYFAILSPGFDFNYFRPFLLWLFFLYFLHPPLALQRQLFHKNLCSCKAGSVRLGIRRILWHRWRWRVFLKLFNLPCLGSRGEGLYLEIPVSFYSSSRLWSCQSKWRWR